MGGRKAWEAAGKDTVVKVDGFSRADPNSRLVWEMIPGNGNNMQVNETAEKALFSRQFTTRQASKALPHLRCDICGPRKTERLGHLRGDTLSMNKMCLQGS